MIPLRDTERSLSTPWVTIALIVINCLIFLYEISLPPAGLELFVRTFAVVPADLNPLTLLSSMFLHGGWMHLIGNMWFLWIFGDNVEDVLGRQNFILFYLGSGVAASIVHIALNANSPIPTLGASGAIAGVMGAYMLKFPKSRILTLLPLVIIFTTIEIPATIVLLYWFVIQLFSGTFSLGAASVGGGTAWFAHVGGFLAGMLLIQIFRTKRERKFVYRQY
jgi:membrane associated rhomboid family serine protease